MLEPCVLVGLDWAEPMMFLLLHVTCLCIFHAYVPFFSFFLYYCWLVLFCFSLSLSLSLSLSNSLRMAPKCKFAPSQNLLRFEASSSSDPTPSHVRFCDDKACQDFSENISKRGIHSKCHVILLDFSDTDLLTVIHKRGWKSLCEILVSCPSVIIHDFYSNMHRFDYSIPHFLTFIWDLHIVVTSKLISNMLHVPRVSHPNYPGCHHLQTMSKDELLSLFCETPSSWGDHQNTSCSSFAKGLRFLNMVMTFVLHPLSNYNSNTEPRDRFLLSLI